MSLMKATITGHLGKDAEVFTYGSDSREAVKLRVAVNKGYGEKKQVFWHQVVCFQKSLIQFASGLMKGDGIAVVGDVEPKFYEAANNNNEVVVYLEIVADSIDRTSSAQPRQDNGDQGRPAQQPPQQQQQNTQGRGGYSNQRGQNAPPANNGGGRGGYSNGRGSGRGGGGYQNSRQQQPPPPPQNAPGDDNYYSGDGAF